MITTNVANLMIAMTKAAKETSTIDTTSTLIVEVVVSEATTEKVATGVTIASSAIMTASHEPYPEEQWGQLNLPYHSKLMM